MSDYSMQKEYTLHGVLRLSGGRQIFVEVRMLNSYTQFYQLRKALYGLRDAPRKWNQRLRADLVALGYRPLVADPSLFVQCVDGPASLYCDPTTFREQAQRAPGNFG